MNAQAFFEMCRGVADTSPVQPISSFGDEEDFIDFIDFVDEPVEDDFVEEPVVAEAGPDKIESVTIQQIEAPSADGTLLGYFSDWLHTNVGTSEDVVNLWNQHADSNCSYTEEALREFVLMHFGIRFVGETSITQLRVSELDVSGLHYPVTVEIFEQLKNYDCDVHDLQMLGRQVELSTAAELLALDDYSQEEVLQYIQDPEVFQLYVELKLKKCFVREKFDTAILRAKAGGVLRDIYFDKSSELFTLVSSKEKVQLLQKALDAGYELSAEFVKTYEEAELLETVLTARINGTVDDSVEALMLSVDSVPGWFQKGYYCGMFKNGDTTKSLAYCCATAECKRVGIDRSGLENSGALTKLMELHYTCRVPDDTYLKLLYCLSRGIDVNDMLSTQFKSFEYYWISRLLGDAGLDAAIPGFVGDMIVIVNAEGKIRLLDVVALVYNYNNYRDTINSEYVVELLQGNHGVLLVHASRKALIPKLVGIKYLAQSSLGRWTKDFGVASHGDPGRCNLYELERGLESIPDGLRAWETCPLSKYQQADRCFGYALDVVPEAKYLFGLQQTQKVIKTVLSGVQIQDKITFVWHFLKTFFRDGYNCKVFEKAKTKEYVVNNEVIIDLEGKISRVSVESFMQGFSGIVESVDALGSIALDNTQGTVYVKICKNFI